MEYVVIGIDCAVQPADVGLARLRGGASGWRLDAVSRASTMQLPAQTVAEWIYGETRPVLLALDAPLGWPVRMGEVLSVHSAGQPLPLEGHALFRRETDRFIAEKFRKTPLDVGADRIARTAHWAVNFIARLSTNLGIEIPVVWSPALTHRISVIEVYPAATLLAHGASLAGYKAAGGRSERAAIYAMLGQRFTCSDDSADAIDSPHVIDAALCALAGADFLEGHAVAPENIELAQREGWIWSRAPRPPVIAVYEQ